MTLKGTVRPRPFPLSFCYLACDEWFCSAMCFCHSVLPPPQAKATRPAEHDCSLPTLSQNPPPLLVSYLSQVFHYLDRKLTNTHSDQAHVELLHSHLVPVLVSFVPFVLGPATSSVQQVSDFITWTFCRPSCHLTKLCCKELGPNPLSHMLQLYTQGVSRAPRPMGSPAPVRLPSLGSGPSPISFFSYSHPPRISFPSKTGRVRAEIINQTNQLWANYFQKNISSRKC